MIANLRGCTETQLLEFVRDILTSGRPFTNAELIELKDINDEFIRRDAMKLQKLCYYCYKSMADGPYCPHCGAN